MAEIEHAERYTWWLSELESLGGAAILDSANSYSGVTHSKLYLEYTI